MPQGEPRRLLWIAPAHHHRLRYRLWCLTHWRRVREFRRYMEQRIRDEVAKIMGEKS